MKQLLFFLFVVLTLTACNQANNTTMSIILPTPVPMSEGGGKIVFESDRDGDYEIFIINADGSNLKRLTDNDWDDSFPAWSPDGTQIVFSSDEDGDDEIYVININGTGLKRLTDNDWDDYRPSWQP